MHNANDDGERERERERVKSMIVVASAAYFAVRMALRCGKATMPSTNARMQTAVSFARSQKLNKTVP